MEDYGYEHIEKLPQLVTTLNSRNNCLVNLELIVVKKSVLSLLNCKPLRAFRKPKFKIGDRVRISKFDSSFGKDYTEQFTQIIFKIRAVSSRKLPKYTIKDKQHEIILGIFYEKELIKIIQQWNRLTRVGFKCICATASTRYTGLFYKLFPEQLNLEGHREIAIS